jgi:hypothetical protein
MYEWNWLEALFFLLSSVGFAMIVVGIGSLIYVYIGVLIQAYKNEDIKVKKTWPIWFYLILGYFLWVYFGYY